MGSQNVPSASNAPSKQPVVHRGRSASLPLPSRKPKRVALLIGCRYKDNEHYPLLHQTRKDVLKLKKLFKDVYHYDDKDIIVLLDDDKHLAPTKENIVNEMKRLVAGAKAGDSFFFYFAGHGEQAPCETGEEPDGMDEAIVPCDATENKDSWIIDNDMNRLLVRKIPVNAQLIAFFDMCHSGTAMDLNHYCYNEEGSVHAFKRTSHGTVDNESRKISELPQSEVSPPQQDACTSKHKRRSNTRHFSYMKRTGTIHCELSEGSDGGTLGTTIEAAESIKPEPHRDFSCADCGGFLDEDELYDDLVIVEVHDEQCEDQHGFVPDRPADSPVRSLRPMPQRKTKRLPSLDTSPPVQEQQSTTIADAVARRHSYPFPRDAHFGCLSTLRLDWLPLFIKRKFHISSKVVNNEGKEGAGHVLPSRASTTNSLTPLFPTPPISRPVSTYSLISAPPNNDPVPVICAPKSTRKFLKRDPTPVVQAPGLGDIQEDVSVSSFHDNVGEIPRCTSPQQYTASGPTSPISVTTPETPISTAGAVLRGPRRVTRNVGADCRRGKCNCMAPSGVQEHGQVITIGGCSDAQLAWETKKGTLTSALVEILEKDAHPTYESLLASLQAFLNDMSDELRQTVTWTKNHAIFKKLKRSAKKRGQQQEQQQQQGRRKRSNSASTPGSRRSSHKSGDDIGADFLDTFDQVLEQAQGGPVQTAIIGTQNFMDLAKVRFNPRGSLPVEPEPLASHSVEHHL